MYYQSIIPFVLLNTLDRQPSSFWTSQAELSCINIKIDTYCALKFTSEKNWQLHLDHGLPLRVKKGNV